MVGVVSVVVSYCLYFGVALCVDAVVCVVFLCCNYVVSRDCCRLIH